MYVFICCVVMLLINVFLLTGSFKIYNAEQCPVQYGVMCEV